MSFSSSLKNLIAESDEQNVIWRKLIQTIRDKGGDTEDMNYLLADAKGPNLLIGEFARLIRRYWNWTHESIDLPNINFKISARDFVAQYPHLKFHPNMDFRHYKENEVTVSCRYRLHQFMEPMLSHDLIHAFDRDRDNAHATWRELIVFTNNIPYAAKIGRPVLAVGSPVIETIDDETREAPTFPAMHEEKDGHHISWRGVKRPAEEKFPTDLLYLVRVAL